MIFFKNTLWLMFDKGLKLVINFFIAILITRYLGPENFGILSFSQSIIAIFVAFSSLGLEVVLVREMTKNKSNAGEILGTAVILKSVISFISFLILALYLLWFESGVNQKVLFILSFSVLIQSINLGLDTYFQANVLSKYTSICGIASSAICSILKLCFLFYKAPLEWFAFVIMLESFILFIFLTVVLRSIVGMREISFSIDLAKSYLKNCWPLVVVSLSVVIYSKIDIIMLNSMLGNWEAGTYSAAIRLIDIFYLVPILITQSVFPKMVELKAASPINYHLFLENITRILVLISLPVCIVLFFFGDFIVALLYGSLYAQASGALRVLSISVVIFSIGMVSTKILYVEHYEKKYLIRSLFGIVMNTISNYVLIPKFGINGAAMATVLTLFSIHYVFDLFDKDLRRFFYIKIICFNPIFNTKRSLK